MVKSQALWCLVLGGVMLVGCKKEETAVQPTAPTPGSTAATRPSSLDSVRDVLKSGEAKTEEMMADASAGAQGMMDKIKGYMQKNDLASADKIMTKLESVKDKLPQSIQDDLAKLRAEFDTLKNSASTAIKSATTKPTTAPSLPVIPSLPPAIP